MFKNQNMHTRVLDAEYRYKKHTAHIGSNYGILFTDLNRGIIRAPWAATSNKMIVKFYILIILLISRLEWNMRTPSRSCEYSGIASSRLRVGGHA